MGRDSVHRTPSGGASSSPSAASAKIWRFWPPRRNLARDDKNGVTRSSSGDADANDLSLRLRPTDSASTIESYENNCRKLQGLVQRVRSVLTNPSHVDAAYHEFGKHKDTCFALCHAMLHDQGRVACAPVSAAGSLLRRDSSMDSPSALAAGSRSSFSGRSVADAAPAVGSRAVSGYESRLAAIRELKNCLEAMTDAFQASLADTYKSYERDATPEMVEMLFHNRRFRRVAVDRMRNASVTSIRSADPQFFPRYEIRFYDYEKAKQELSETRRLLQCAESGISPSRPVELITISARGDAILEFANLAADPAADEPVLRFRVASYTLAEASPIFARIFSGHAASLHLHDTDDIVDQLPPPPSSHVCADGAEVKLYRMPQHEVDRLGSLRVLLHAAHMHHEEVPREVAFDQFVAIAECSMHYKCTSPLEIVVEHRWLPQWMHQGADDMPDGLLAISYAFGVRELFTRTSKSAILDLVDEADLGRKPWPQKIKDKIWAVRCAKVAQVHACCAGTLQEYMPTPARGPGHEPEPVSPANLRRRLAGPAAAAGPALALTGSPRCPKGVYGCDATNLGWLMLALNEMDLLPQTVRPATMTHLSETGSKPRSLAQIFDVLRRMPSPATPLHRGVCDPAPSLRAAIADVYDSIAGLTLHDISGKSHGWALSKHQMNEPQPATATGLERMAAQDRTLTAARDLPDSVRLQILDQLHDVGDLQAAARTSRDFYHTFQGHEGHLARKFPHRQRLGGGSGGGSGGERMPRADDGKVLKAVADQIKGEGQAELDAVTLRSDDESDESESESESEDGTVSNGGTSTPAAHGGPILDPPGYAEGGSSPGRAPAPTSARTSSRHPGAIPASAEDAAAPMTDEEAAQIIWPAALFPATRNPAPAAEGLREKFRRDDLCFAEGLEEKMLVVMGQKQLRGDHDRLAGLVEKIDAGAGCLQANAGAG